MIVICKDDFIDIDVENISIYCATCCELEFINDGKEYVEVITDEKYIVTTYENGVLKILTKSENICKCTSKVKIHYKEPILSLDIKCFVLLNSSFPSIHKISILSRRVENCNFQKSICEISSEGVILGNAGIINYCTGDVINCTFRKVICDISNSSVSNCNFTDCKEIVLLSEYFYSIYGPFYYSCVSGCHFTDCKKIVLLDADDDNVFNNCNIVTEI